MGAGPAAPVLPADRRELGIRRASEADATAVAAILVRSFRATYPTFPVVHPLEEVLGWVAGSVIPAGGTWLAVEGEEAVAVLVHAPGWVEQLYVAPGRSGEGIGRRLLDHAKALEGGPLELWTFQVNERARRFYRGNGFVELEWTDGTGNEEERPDVRLRWDPARDPR